jgi:hypothetical protein
MRHSTELAAKAVMASAVNRRVLNTMWRLPFPALAKVRANHYGRDYIDPVLKMPDGFKLFADEQQKYSILG